MQNKTTLCETARHVIGKCAILFCCMIGHPKVRVFVTHGGLMGSTEAAHCGVPVVVTPMYGDQVNSTHMSCMIDDVI